MKTFDVVLIFVALVLVFLLVGFDSSLFDGFGFSLVLKIILALFLFFYFMGWKLSQYKDKMYPTLQKFVDYQKKVSEVLQNIFVALNVPKIQLGEKLSVGSVHIVIVALVLIFLIILQYEIISCFIVSVCSAGWNRISF